MPDLPLSDISLHYEVDGRGPPLLMLAGMLSDSASWGALAPLLSDHFTEGHLCFGSGIFCSCPLYAGFANSLYVHITRTSLLDNLVFSVYHTKRPFSYGTWFF